MTDSVAAAIHDPWSLLSAALDQPDRPALLTAEGTISFAELADRVDAARARLGMERRLVLLATRNHPDAVVLYLAALAGGHPLILVDAGNDEAFRSLFDAYDPDVVAYPRVRAEGGWEIDERRAGTAHDLHPDLALLLSTSGSTGSPKLVRLSATNLRANAEAIASFLAITPADRAITSLPLAYCYGLSVLNSHLLRGASVALTERSVIEREFWDLFRRTGATSLAGVPYTFDLLDRVGFAGMHLPSLRCVTQAGGRLDPSTVRRYAEQGERDGWELFVMYGQTEATARMAYLPAALATTRPESIGTPIPGGSIRLDPFPDAPDGAGEIVFGGPNVMLGYAEGPADLASGRTVHELRTGDIGRRGPDGLYEIVGRRAEFLKIAGLRIDPASVERMAGRHGARACAVGTDERLVVFAEPGATGDLHAILHQAFGLPARAVKIVELVELPRLANGKLNRMALKERARELDAADAEPEAPDATHEDATSAVRELYARALGRPAVADGDSFSSLGGDSLTYVEVTLGLEEILGRLPGGWATLSVAELGAIGPARAERVPAWWAPLSRWRTIETSVALRAVAILLVVATHIGMLGAAGGAHVLIAVAGYNFARFRLTAAARGDRVRSQLRATARIALPAMAWVAAVMLLTGEYELRHLLLVNALVRDELWGNLWFIELLVYIGLAMAAFIAIPTVDRAERSRPFAVALGVVGIGLLFRFEIVSFPIPYTMPVLWLFALGWAASRAERAWQRALVLAIALAAVPGYFESLERTAIILAGVTILVCVPRVVVPGAVARAVAVLAAASLYIYLVHWEVWPLFQGWYGLPSLAASLAAGIGLWMGASRVPGLVGRIRRWILGRGPVRAGDLARALGGPATVGPPVEVLARMSLPR